MNGMGRKNSWGEEIGSRGLVAAVLQGFFSSAFDLLEGALETMIKEQQGRILKKLSVAVVFLTGSLFLLNALALFINDYLEAAAWVGYGIVGSALVLLAIIFRKE